MLELEHGFQIVDLHTRLDPEESAVARGEAITPDNLEREMHQAGVVRSVVFPGPREGSYVKANNGVARMSVDRPFVAFARINGAREIGGGVSKLHNILANRKEWHTTPRDIEQYGYDDRFVGFKLDPYQDGMPDREVLHRLEEVGMPLLVNAGETFPPDETAATLFSYAFPVVLAHFGGHPLNRGLMARSIELLGEREGVYLDTSAVRFRDLLERAIMEHPDRVLFGSGAPNTHPSVGVMEILTLDVPEDAMRRVFSKNAERMLEDTSIQVDLAW